MTSNQTAKRKESGRRGRESHYLKQECPVESGESRLASPLPCCDTLAKLLQLSEPVYPSGSTLCG